MTPLLPGPGPGPWPSARLEPAARPSRLLRFVIIVWVLGGLCYLGFRFSGIGGTRAIAPPTSQPITAISTEDLAHHVADMGERLDQATSDVRRVEDQISRTLDSVSRNYMLIEKRRLETALALSESVKRDLEQSRQQADLIRNSLEKEHEQK